MHRSTLSPVNANTHGMRFGHHVDGGALIIVLAFMVMLLGLVMAFFSHSLSERQVSKSSGSQTKVELFAQGAADSIISDLKQEIAAGSTPWTTNVGGVTVTNYFPTASTNMVPALAGSSGTGGLENLVKLSAYGQKFYYPDGPTRACNSSSASASLNGRSYTASLWNKPLLMSPTSSTDFTPQLAGATFTPPDWVLVSRNGANPTFWSADLKTSAANSATVVGRYAYTIYDEGGLLDANVAGYPSTSTTNQYAYKQATAYADLTQIGLTADQSDQLVAWRNWASSQAPGDKFTLPGFTAASGAAYYSNTILSNFSGFLRTGGVLNRGQSDRKFTSRQELLRFLQNGILGLSPDSPAYQCLGTFSRALEQPSFAPDPNRPKIVTGNGGNYASGSDNNINPSFLRVRVGTSFTRNDGTSASAGDPLVIKRFALNRLAWLTYAGPITLDGSSYNPNLATSYINSLKRTYGLSDAFLLQGTPANIYKYFGLSWIQDVASANRVPGDGQNKWLYDHSQSAPMTALGSGGVIKRINTLTTRESDFFELLKAGIACGSKAKGGTAPVNTTPLNSNPFDYNYKVDTSLEFAIIQIGANIIDQFDLDGFPTRIVFYDGSFPAKEFRGVENMPYLYGVRQGVVEGAPPQYTSNTVTDSGYMVGLQQPVVWNPHDSSSPRCAVDPSTGAYLLDSSGNPLFPTVFRCVADSKDPTNIDPSDSGNATYSTVAFYTRQEPFLYIGTNTCSLNPSSSASTNKNIIASPFTSISTTNVTIAFAANRFVWSPNNNALQFKVNEATSASALNYFREPTFLIHSSVAGSTLMAAGANNVMVPGNSSSMTIPNNTQAADIKVNPSALTTNGVKCSADGNYYLGMFMGVQPVGWAYDFQSNTLSGISFKLNNPNIDINHSFSGSTSATFAMTFRMQYQSSGTWATYDEKYIGTYANNTISGMKSVMPNGLQNTDGTGQMVGLCGAQVADPRTGRFCPVLTGNSGTNNNTTSTPDITWPSGGWLDGAKTIVPSARPDACSGYAIWNGSPTAPTAPVSGWYPASATNNPGMISQNVAGLSPTAKTWSGGLANSYGNTYYSDPDGIVRKASGAYAGTSMMGLPMANAYTNGSTATTQVQSRPIVLNRPFRNVGELGYVFSGTPWKNIDFFTPESGDCPLLDLFCINDMSDPGAMVAGKVNLNTRQPSVIQAIVNGGYKDEQAFLYTSPSWKVSPLTAAEASKIATKLVTRTTDMTTSGKGPLVNVSDLVGRFVSGTTYDGFSADLSTGIFQANTPSSTIQRLRDAPIRALAACGQTRVWNLMIDVVAQTGRYPASASSLDQFLVEGEQRYWVHVAIDRLTGQVIDKQVERVKE